MRYIISDTHFGHGNIIDYCGRPFDDADDMDAQMYALWGDAVDDGDTVIHLGDVRHHPDTIGTDEWLRLLPGDIMLVRGNHDGDATPNSPAHVVESATIRHGRYTFYLEHQPVTGVPGWQIHGHEHNLIHFPFIDEENQRVNASVERIGYQPLSMDELVHHLEKKNYYRDLEHARSDSNTYPL